MHSPTVHGSSWKQFLLGEPLGFEQGPRKRVAVAGAVMGGVLLLLTVLAAPTSRLIVPIGAPGSTLPDWILGVFAPIGDTPKALGRGAIAAGMDWGKLFVSVGFFALAWAWLAIVREAENIPVKVLVWGIVGVYVLLVIAPPMFSTDIFTYLSGGRLQVLYGVNPYEHGPVVRPQDPVFGWTGLVWLDTPTVYGPIFTLLTAALTPLGPAGGMWTLKVIAALSAGACGWLTWKIAEDLGRPPENALAFVALNPILLLFALAGGHNDLLMLAIALAAVRLTILAKPLAAGATLGAAIAVKLTAGLVLPFMFIGAGKRAENGRTDFVKGFLLLWVPLAAVATAFYGLEWLKVPKVIGQGMGQHIGELKSVPGIVAGYAGLGPIGPVTRGLFLVVLIGIVVLAFRAAERTRDGWIGWSAVVIVASLTLSTQLHPWYLIWALPFAALSGDKRVRGLAVGLTFAVIAIQAIRWLAPLGVGWPHSG